jgi:hypothetical protein
VNGQTQRRPVYTSRLANSLPILAGTSYAHSGAPSSVSVSDSAYCCWLLLASAAYPETRINQRSVHAGRLCIEVW